MGHYRLLFPSDYVGAWDLPDDKTVTIEKIRLEELRVIGGKSENKPIAYFKGATKRMVLNKTNCKTIAALYGTDTSAWMGKAVTLFATTCSGKGGDVVECIRVRPCKPSRCPTTKPGTDPERLNTETSAAADCDGEYAVLEDETIGYQEGETE